MCKNKKYILKPKKWEGFKEQTIKEKTDKITTLKCKTFTYQKTYINTAKHIDGSLDKIVPIQTYEVDSCTMVT